MNAQDIPLLAFVYPAVKPAEPAVQKPDPQPQKTDPVTDPQSQNQTNTQSQSNQPTQQQFAEPTATTTPVESEQEKQAREALVDQLFCFPDVAPSSKQSSTNSSTQQAIPAPSILDDL